MQMMFRRRKFPLATPLIVALGLYGCAGNCALGLSHADCVRFDAVEPHFPSDDSICGSYGLRRGTKAYGRCRLVKLMAREKAEAAYWAGLSKNGL
jgi:hypothetical protein